MPSDADKLRRDLEAKDLASLERLGNTSASASERLRVDLFACPKCDGTSTLTVKSVKTTVDSKGKASEATTDLVALLRLDVHERDRVRALAKRPLVAVAAEPA